LKNFYENLTFFPLFLSFSLKNKLDEGIVFLIFTIASRSDAACNDKDNLRLLRFARCGFLGTFLFLEERYLCRSKIFFAGAFHRRLFFSKQWEKAPTK